MALYSAIQNLFPDLKDIEYFKSSSAGNSFKYKAVKGDDNEKVIVKISFDPTIKLYNYQIVESQIYEHILSGMQKNTPHLPKFYGVKKTKFGNLNGHEFMIVCDWGSNDSWNLKKGQVMVIKNVGENNLYSVWDKTYDDPLIVFQVLYTIACFERVGLKHNDLHLGNIMIQDCEPTEINYNIDGKIISLTTTKFVKIIDYDRSCIYHENVERNGYLDYLQDEDDPVCQYNGINKGHDTFKFLRSYNGGKIKTWISFVCPRVLNAIYKDDLIPQDIDPSMYLPDTVFLLESLVENFDSHFTVSLESKERFYSLPEHTGVKPIIDNTKFPASKITIAKSNVGSRHVYKELLNVGYNWKLHHCKLFEEVKNYVLAIKPTEKEMNIYNACIQVTNPLRNSYHEELEILILEKFTHLIRIPQKYSIYLEEQHEEDEEDEEDEEQDEEDEEQDEEEEQVEEVGKHVQDTA